MTHGWRIGLGAVVAAGAAAVLWVAGATGTTSRPPVTPRPERIVRTIEPAWRRHAANPQYEVELVPGRSIVRQGAVSRQVHLLAVRGKRGFLSRQRRRPDLRRRTVRVHGPVPGPARAPPRAGDVLRRRHAGRAVPEPRAARARRRDGGGQPLVLAPVAHPVRRAPARTDPGGGRAGREGARAARGPHACCSARPAGRSRRSSCARRLREVSASSSGPSTPATG